MQEEERQLQRLREGAHQAAKRGTAVPGRFIPLAEQSLAVHEARLAGVEVSVDGGWPEAERVQVCFHPPETEPIFTRVWMEIRWDARFAQAEHRALLGSLLGLGIDRSLTGDLIAEADRAWLCCLPMLAVRLPQEWLQAGRIPLQVRELPEAPEIRLPEGVRVRDTVASLRLDCVLSAALGISRAQAAERIRRGEIQVNHRPEERVDRLLAEGDLMSIRGVGRAALREIGLPSRKERLPIILEKWTKG